MLPVALKADRATFPRVQLRKAIAARKTFGRRLLELEAGPLIKLAPELLFRPACQIARRVNQVKHELPDAIRCSLGPSTQRICSANLGLVLVNKPKSNRPAAKSETTGAIRSAFWPM